MGIKKIVGKIVGKPEEKLPVIGRPVPAPPTPPSSPPPPLLSLPMLTPKLLVTAPIFKLIKLYPHEKRRDERRRQDYDMTI